MNSVPPNSQRRFDALGAAWGVKNAHDATAPSSPPVSEAPQITRKTAHPLRPRIHSLTRPSSALIPPAGKPPSRMALRGRPPAWCDGGMEVVLASLIAVAGTLLGSALTFDFQRRSSARAEDFARSQQLRQDRLATYSAYAGSVTALKQGVVALWFHQRSDPDSPATREAFTTCDRLGATTENAHFRVQLLAADPHLITLAASAFDTVDAIRTAPTRTELAAAEQALQAALTAFMTAAAAQIH